MRRLNCEQRHKKMSKDVKVRDISSDPPFYLYFLVVFS
jgi:hypothetical protein